MPTFPTRHQYEDEGHVTFVQSARLCEDEEALLIDPGAYDNSVGDAWVERARRLAADRASADVANMTTRNAERRWP